MTYKVTWTFGKGECESQSFDDLPRAKAEADARALAYAEIYGPTEAKVFDDQGNQLYIKVQG
jgi:hypothetical protein